MKKNEWEKVRNFSIDEKWGDPLMMNPVLINTLDKLRDKTGKPIKIHCGYELRDSDSQHTIGNAVDCHCEGMNLVDFFLEASRFPQFRGIGIYPLWHNPGLHLDVRNKPERALWGCLTPKLYVSLNEKFLLNIINL